MSYVNAVLNFGPAFMAAAQDHPLGAAVLLILVHQLMRRK